VSRRSRRLRARLTATVLPASGEGALLVCRTRDLSDVGVALDTEADLAPGTPVAVVIMDPDRGVAVEVTGAITRTLEGARGVGVQLDQPSDEWFALIDGLARRAPTDSKPARRLKVLVVGDGQRQRGALALYVTSGWDVRFASDPDGATQALNDFVLDAVVAEHDADDARWQPILDEVRRAQPSARRLVRGTVRGRREPTDRDGLVDRFVDPAGGLDALLDALTAELPRQL
jgi:hypothetical protein